MAKAKNLNKGYGQGSLTELRAPANGNKGKYRLRWGRPGIDQKCATVECTTVAAARLQLSQRVNEHRAQMGKTAVDGTPEVHLVSDLMATWLDEGTFRPETYRTYEARVNREVVGSDLADMDVRRVTARDLEKFYRAALARGLAKTTVRNLHSTMRAAFRTAERWQWVDRSAARDVDVKMFQSDTAIELIPIDDLRAIISTARAHGGQIARLVEILAANGCRRGEALGLRWSDVDQDAGTLSIRRSYNMSGLSEDTKTKSGQRVVAAPQALVSAAVVDADALVVGWSPNAADKAWRKLQDELGLNYHMHQIRHSVASKWLDEGVPVATVAKWLGHANAGITLKIYTHSMATDDDLQAVNW